MTTAELHKILDDENKKISLKEYQNVLYQLKNDTIGLSTAEQFENQELTKKYHFYEGETNAFQIALDLSEHINQTQKAIECLKELSNSLIRTSGTLSNQDGSVRKYTYVIDHTDFDEAIDKKIKELEEENKMKVVNNQLLNEIIEACAICIDLHGIDVKKEFPELYKKIKELEGKDDKKRKDI